MRYEFPWPPKELSPNARVHWRALAKAKREYREACGWIAGYEQTWPFRRRRCSLAPPVTARVTFVVTDRQRRDTPNYQSMLKPLWDALVDLGVLIDDNKDVLKIAEPKWERGPEKKVVVDLEESR